MSAKKLLSAFLALCMVILCIPVNASAAEPTIPARSITGGITPDGKDVSQTAAPTQIEDAPVLSARTRSTTVVEITTGGDVKYFSYTPDTSGYYVLTSYSEADVVGALYDADMEEMLSCDDNGPGLNFILKDYLYAGETYYYAFWYYDTAKTGSFNVVLEQGNPATASGKVENYTSYDYTLSDLTLDENGIYRTPSGEAAFIAVDNCEEGGLYYLYGYTLYDYVEDKGEDSFDLTYWTELKHMMDPDGYVLLTEGSLEYLLTLIGDEWEENESYIGCYLFVGEYDAPDMKALTLNVRETVAITSDAYAAYYKFTPSQDGYYSLTSYSNFDTIGTLYDANWEEMVHHDENGPESNFCLKEYLHAGITYYFVVRFYDITETGFFEILLEDGTAVTASGKTENLPTYDYWVSDLTLDAEGIYRTPEGDAAFIAVNNNEEGGLHWLVGYTLYDYVYSYGTDYFDLTYWEALLSLMDEDGYVLLTETSLQYLITLIGGNPVWDEDETYVDCYLFLGEYESAASDVLIGDVNGDSNVNTVDAMLVLQYAVGMLTADELILAASDANQDGTTNTIDAMLILQYAVGLVTSLPVN